MPSSLGKKQTCTAWLHRRKRKADPTNAAATKQKNARGQASNFAVGCVFLTAVRTPTETTISEAPPQTTGVADRAAKNVTLGKAH